ncbi:MAG TPA: hypothetical protein VHT02_10285, partial [Methylocella sp.]|nr:hypothetical protein [Methylocella sp.]
MSPSLRDPRLLASVVCMAGILLAGCSTNNSPPIETQAATPAGVPSMPSQYHPEELIGRWGYGAYHNDSDLARTTSAARAQCGQPVVINRGPNGGVM